MPGGLVGMAKAWFLVLPELEPLHGYCLSLRIIEWPWELGRSSISKCSYHSPKSISMIFRGTRCKTKSGGRVGRSSAGFRGLPEFDPWHAWVKSFLGLIPYMAMLAFGSCSIVEWSPKHDIFIWWFPSIFRSSTTTIYDVPAEAQIA